MKKYLFLFVLILIQGCSSGGGDSTPTTTATAPTSIAGMSASMIITSGSGFYATTGSYTVSFSATQPIYTVVGDVVNVTNSSGTYSYTSSGNTGVVAVVDSASGAGSFVLTYTTDTSGTFVATSTSDPTSKQTGTFTQL